MTSVGFFVPKVLPYAEFINQQKIMIDTKHVMLFNLIGD